MHFFHLSAMNAPVMKNIDIPAIMEILQHEFVNNTMPVVDLIEAQTRDPFKILVATIMSARTQDGTTAAAAARLFARAATPDELELLSEAEIRELIFPVGFYRNKAAYLKQLPGALRDRFGGRIPQTVEELVELPGVGRKTANLVVAVGFHKPAICVDVHVHRITNRWGYLETATPLETEMALRDKLPLEYWIPFNSCLVSFGQNTCRPTRPHCPDCPIEKYCNRVGL